jgi:hypothetical protein
MSNLSERATMTLNNFGSSFMPRLNKEIVEKAEEAVNFLERSGDRLDFEAAREHGRASLVIDRANTIKKNMLTEEQDFKRCKCCDEIIREEKFMYPLWTANVDLGELGPGFPLFFEFIKLTGILLALMTWIYFTPCLVMMVDGYE